MTCMAVHQMQGCRFISFALVVGLLLSILVVNGKVFEGVPNLVHVMIKFRFE